MTADAAVPAARGKREVTIAPLYRRVMPWVLVALGVAVFGMFLVLRTRTTTETMTTSTVPAAGGKLAIQRQTTTDRLPGDELLIAMLAGATLLVLAGAFYARVRKVAFGDTSLEMGDEHDAQAIGMAVAANMVEALDSRGLLPDSGPQRDQLARLLEEGGAASAIAQQHLAAERIAEAIVGPSSFDAADVAMSRAGPLPAALLRRLSDRAVQRFATEDADEAPEPPTPGATG